METARPLINFSVILPTRERPAQLKRAVASLLATAAHPDRVELVLYIDDDDRISQQVELPGIKTVRIVGPRGTMGQMTRACYQAATGTHILLANDDIAFRTAGWDRKVIETFERFPDRIALVWGNDLYSGAPAHPFLSRVACELMGGICPACYYRDYIDTHICDVFRILNRFGHERRVYLPDLVIEHLHVLAGKAEADEVSAKPHHFDDERHYLAWSHERECMALEMATVIERQTGNVASPAAAA